MLVLQQERVANPIEWTLPLLSMIPLAIGLLEDVTKNLGAKTRLALITISALLTVLYLNLHISTVSIWGLDALLLIPAVSTATAVFAIVGLTNAYNIIDGVNGLASMIGVLASLSLGYMGYLLGDPALIQLSFSLVAALLGFFVLNYPRGLIFLGDGGLISLVFGLRLLASGHVSMTVRCRLGLHYLLAPTQLSKQFLQFFAGCFIKKPMCSHQTVYTYIR